MLRALFALLFALTLPLSARAEIINIDHAELSRLLASGVPLIDIRTEPEWRDTGIIAGSRLLTFFDQQGQSDPASWLLKVKTIAKPEQPVIVICRSGNRTRAVSQFLSQQAGYRTVYNVRDGINGWRAANQALVPAAAKLAGCGAGPRRSIVRGKLVSQIARAVGAGLGRLLAQLDDFVREPVDELLLLVDGQVQLVQQVFGEAGLDFQCFKPLKDFVGKG